MKRTLRRWEFIGFLVTGALGTLLHFVYDWSGGNRFLAAISAVNESTWEHMKLLFVPYLLFALVELVALSAAFRSLLACKAVGILLGLAAIPALFYTLTGCLGELPDWANITVFFLADALAYFVSCRLLSRGALRGGAAQLMGAVLLWLLLFAFVWCTFRTPHLPLFRDAVTGCYGLSIPC